MWHVLSMLKAFKNENIKQSLSAAIYPTTPLMAPAVTVPATPTPA